MDSLKCLVILCACSCLAVVSVDGIRVPTSWNDESDAGHKFNVNRGHKFNEEKLLRRRNFIEREHELAGYGNLYGRLKNTALTDFFGEHLRPKLLSQGEIFILSDKNQETSSSNRQQNTSPVQISNNYQESHPQINKKRISPINTNLNVNQPTLPQNYQRYGGDVTHKNGRSNILPISSGYLESYKGAQAEIIQPDVNQLIQKYNPEGYKKFTQLPKLSYEVSNDEAAPQSLINHAHHNEKFIISASEENATPTPIKSIEFTTKKEPIFFVTEGYRNVLVQGPSKKRIYQRPLYQNKDESDEGSNIEKSGNNDSTETTNDEIGKPSRRRQETKVYKIHRNDGEKGRNIGGENKNNIEAEYGGKQKQYFQRPNIYTENDRRSGLRKHLIKNYRDDTLHEPISDYNSEREDIDTERINSDELKVNEDEVENDDSAIKDGGEEESNGNSNHTDENEKADTENNDDEESDADDSEDEEDEVPHSEHADPKPIPTKPFYPGEGAWAKKGVKHKPYISQHRFLKPQDADGKPDGHDVFEELEKYFEKQKDHFGDTFGEKLAQPFRQVPTIGFPPIKSPNLVNHIVVYDPFNESSEENPQRVPEPKTTKSSDYKETDNEDEENEDEEGEEKELESENDNTEDEESEGEEDDEFVPMQLYTQVRKTDNEEHEPYDPLEHGRLREVIKDSKIQTVYTEEGYEDSAYDHAGHEKKAEQDQGHEEFEREKLEKIKPSMKEEQEVDQNEDTDQGPSEKVLVSDTVTDLDDSLPSDSIFPSLSKENPIDMTKQPKTSNARSPKMTKNNNFITTKEIKTTQVKDKKNGDLQLEIQSEVKVIVHPNNSTKSHKFVKIYPKVFKQYSKAMPDFFNENKDNLTNSVNHTQESIKPWEAFSSPQSIDKQDVIASEAASESSTVSVTEITTSPKIQIKAYSSELEIPSSIDKPKVKVKILDNDSALDKISEEFGRIGSLRNRKKRSIDDIVKEVEIDVGFIDKINHTFAPKKPDIVDGEKYPYYTRKDINPNSPLRYAENMKSIPIKKEGELSFYKMADRYECPEIPQNIDPIPEHVKNARENNMGQDVDYEDEDDDNEEQSENEHRESEEEESDDEHSVTPKTPRIKLGDKIECLKHRYFGENPLDSPIFKEETVGPVIPIFRELGKKNIRKNDNLYKSTDLYGNFEKINEIFNQIDKKDERKFETETKDKVFNLLNERIDKIENAESIATSIKVPKPSTSEKPSQSVYGKFTESPLVTLITTPKYTIQLKPKNIYDQIKLLDHLPEEEKENITESNETTTKVGKLTVKNEEVRDFSTERNDRKEDFAKREPRVLTQTNSQEEDIQNISENESPEAVALTRRRFRPRRPVYQIFDVNRYLPTTPIPIIQQVHSTVLPKSKVISEVFYKDEIKPNEQLNVFADVLNNIKNSNNLAAIPIQSASNFAEPHSVTISTLEENDAPKLDMTNVRVKKYQRDGSVSQYLNPKNSVQSSTEQNYNARYPTSYEEHHNLRNPTTNKYIPDLDENIPNSFVHITKNSESKLETAISHPDTHTDQSDPPPRSTINRKVLKRRKRPVKGTTSTTSTTLRTTTNINVSKSTVPSNHQPYVIDYLEDTERVVGLVPPSKGPYNTIVEDSLLRSTNESPEQTYEYQTSRPNTIPVQIIANSPAPVTELIDEVPQSRTINKYFFLGLRPPSPQRVRSYSDFLGNNIFVNSNVVKRRVSNYGHGHHRFKREAARTYSEVSRNRGRQNEGLSTTPVDDIDDYVPHRPTNFHYDEKTGEIVYHKKPQEVDEEEDEEYEEIEIPDTPGVYLEKVEDATHPTPKKATTKPLLATATPPPAGKGLLDFVAKLKNNPSYVYIPDPTTPDPESAKSTTLSTITVDSKSTNPPEFLSILARVKSDDNYKFIEDPKESKNEKKSKTTTPEPEDEEYEDEEEDSEEENVQNSPGEQTPELSNIQIFDVNEYLPKTKTISPKTSIDYSKYKTIERPHVRHNMSSRYNSEEQPNLEEVVTVRRPIIMKEQESIDRPVVSAERVVHNKDVEIDIKEEEQVTTERIVQFRRGTRPTTQKTTSETMEHSGSVTTRRTVNRRRPLPSNYRVTRGPSTTTQVTEVPEKVERVYPENTQTERIYSQTHEPAKRVYRRRPVRIRHTTERQEEDADTADRFARRSLGEEFDDVRNEFERAYLEDRTVQESYDEVKDEILNGKNKNTDFNKKQVIERIMKAEHPDLEEKYTSESSKKEIIEKPVVIINGNYHSTNKHGWNDKKIIHGKDNPKHISINNGIIFNKNIREEDENNNNKGKPSSTQNVEIIDRNFDKNKKHGGNYIESKDDAGVEIVTEVNDEVPSKELYNGYRNRDGFENARDVQIIDEELDRSHKHGVNHNFETKGVKKSPIIEIRSNENENRSSEYSKEAIVREVPRNLKSEIDIINPDFDRHQKHGGNYKAEQDVGVDGSLATGDNPGENFQKQNVQTKDNIIRPRTIGRSIESKEYDKNRIRQSSNNIPRLTDIVPKPDHFYTDPKLPDEINRLKNDAVTIRLNSEELELLTEDGDFFDSDETLTDLRSNNKAKYKKDTINEPSQLLNANNTNNDNDKDSERKEIQSNVYQMDKKSIKKIVPTKKPLFIKDPSKRLYFYVPE